jgi:nicotinamide riboside kinase
MTPALPAGCVIALLGASGTGKTWLAQALTERLLQRGIAAELVPDPHGQWGQGHVREPDAAALAGIAAAQTRRIAAAARRGVVVADTTALMAAVDSEIRFGDTSLHESALTAHHGYAITLLMALDAPPGAPGDTAQRTDDCVRAALARAGAPYAVIHGQGNERLSNAWNVINLRAEAAGGGPAERSAGGERAWFWPCDKCSDPDCEHRLFRDLVARRS